MNKLLAQKGWGSRREMDQYISAGCIQVDGVVVTTLGTCVSPNANVTFTSSCSSLLQQNERLLDDTVSENIDNNIILPQHLDRNRKITVLLNKPAGYVSCQPDYYGSSIERRLRRQHTRSKEFSKNSTTVASSENHHHHYDQRKHIAAIQLLTKSNYFCQENISTTTKIHHLNDADSINLHDDDDDYNEPIFTKQQQKQRQQKQFMEPLHLKKLGTVGRLDINSTGLLLFTQDGLLARSIIGPHSTVEKEYHVRVRFQHQIVQNNSKNVLTTILLDSIIEKLQEGILDKDELLLAKSVTVLTNYPTTSHHHDQLLSSGAASTNRTSSTDQSNTTDNNILTLKFVLTQGKYHHIRRMCSAVHLQVLSLHRVRIGTEYTIDHVPIGKWIYA